MVPARRLIEAGRKEFGGINLCDYVFEFEMGATEREPFGSIALRKHEDARFLILLFHGRGPGRKKF
ncbi:MAG: hypothetical protein WB524_22045 [Acidobacteriaceae bacterium]